MLNKELDDELVEEQKESHIEKEDRAKVLGKIITICFKYDHINLEFQTGLWSKIEFL